ncbi:MAG: tetraacyldisaccharide 4'-kinase [Desulfobacterales bacterium]|nr:tetraacyldisaccharide 4'-kinase [Desulfobacterales bacterium]MDD4071184.1 tetraacyldisaccharide 4'-kinase [Desulfobacterales bacterium]MDD4392192.1 tetraacyldisaccharide 4'-kinase [Desulfobacterales bacterium]
MLQHLRQQIEKIIADPEPGHPSVLKRLLFWISLGYAAAVRLKNVLYDRGILSAQPLDCRVISIGNITMGGTGKTPMAIYVARLVKQLGYKPAVVSRGYRGKAEHAGGVVSDGCRIFMQPDESGDEPYMIARTLEQVPVLVGKERFESGRLALERFGPDVIILDDGFQHRRLSRDIDLVLLDNARPFGNTYLFPRGGLRESALSLKRADACIMTRCASGCRVPDAGAGSCEGKPVFRSDHVPCMVKVVKGERPISVSDLGDLRGASAIVFSAIACNTDFRSAVERLGCRIVRYLEFSDHHWYSKQDIVRIRSLALASDVNLILTTEKDYVRINSTARWPVTLVVIGIEISFGDDADRFRSFLGQRLKK